jgi:hypothetical protein
LRVALATTHAPWAAAAAADVPLDTRVAVQANSYDNTGGLSSSISDTQCGSQCSSINGSRGSSDSKIHSREGSSEVGDQGSGGSTGPLFWESVPLTESCAVKHKAAGAAEVADATDIADASEAADATYIAEVTCVEAVCAGTDASGAAEQDKPVAFAGIAAGSQHADVFEAMETIPCATLSALPRRGLMVEPGADASAADGGRAGIFVGSEWPVAVVGRRTGGTTPWASPRRSATPSPRQASAALPEAPREARPEARLEAPLEEAAFASAERVTAAVTDSKTTGKTSETAAELSEIAPEAVDAITGDDEVAKGEDEEEVGSVDSLVGSKGTDFGSDQDEFEEAEEEQKEEFEEKGETKDGGDEDDEWSSDAFPRYFGVGFVNGSGGRRGSGCVSNESNFGRRRRGGGSGSDGLGAGHAWRSRATDGLTVRVLCWFRVVLYAYVPFFVTSFLFLKACFEVS